MATTSLKITYNTADGTTIHTWRYADPEVTKNAVNALVTATITNGTLFARPPLSVKEAKTVVTTETVIELG